ncbi:ATP-binding protein [Streptosporangium canum]|uniref:ATP-binding protein n=1 Tax=Streptosporangium canum TaxID=324952 RepID=UPI00368540CE
MAARLLAMLASVFTDRSRTAAHDTTGPAHQGPLLGHAPTGPLVISRRFRATPHQIRPARHFVAGILGDGHPLRDDAVLLTSELATNAVEHPSGPFDGPQEFLVTVAFVVHGVLITVQDPGSSQIPCPRDSGPDATGGRGLALVNSLASRWGFHRDSVGTVIWFELGSPAERLPAERGTAEGPDTRRFPRRDR